MRAWLLIALVACEPHHSRITIQMPVSASPGIATSAPAAPILVERPQPAAPTVAPRIELDVRSETAYHTLAEHDPRLDDVARDLARVIDAGGSADKSLADRLLHMHGIVESAQHVAIAATREDIDRAFAGEANLVNAQITIAKTRTGFIGMLVYLGFVNLDGVPRVGGHFPIAGTFASDMTNLRIVIDGKTPQSVVIDGHAFHTELSCSSPGQHAISITVTDPKRATSPRVTFPVYCGVAPAKVTAEPMTNLDVTADQIPEQLLGILDRERVAVSLPALHVNSLLGQVTTSLNDDRSKRIASVEAWHVKHAGLSNPFVQFTTVHAETFSDAVSLILDDSTQNQKLFDGHNTDVAIALVQDHGYWITVGYLAVPVVHDLVAVQKIIANRIHGSHAERVEQAAMSASARVLANQLAAGAQIDDLLTTRKKTFTGYQVSAEMSIDLDNYDIGPVIAKYDFAKFGVGLAQAPQDGPGAGLVFIVIYFAPPDDSEEPFDPSSTFAHRKARQVPKDEHE
ncbi:MAG: hypothetical protein QM831_13460 [Kofleriaceae bacterium]